MLLLVGVILTCAFLVDAAVFEDKLQGDFDSGVYYGTFYDSSGWVQLTPGYSFGNFTSRIFDAGGSVAWQDFSWVQGGPYGADLPDNGISETQWILGNANMSGNVLLLHLDETSGTLVDTSGFGNNGASSGGVAYGVDGVFADALSFDGSSGHVSVPHSSSLLMNDNYTIEFWIKPASDATPWVVFVDKSGQFHLQFIGDDKIRVQIFGYGNLDSNTQLARGVWSHVAFTILNSPNGNDVISLYINGVLDKSNGPMWGTPFSGTSALTIGGGSGQYFKSSFDEFAVYNRVLSASEISSHYERGALKLNVNARSCDDSLCSGENFVALGDNPPQNLSVSDNQYFQYKIDFLSSDSDFSPRLYNTSVNYDILNSAPSIFIASPANGSLFSKSSLSLNYSVSDADGNLDSCWYNLDNEANVSLADCANVSFPISDGLHVINVFANDSYGLEGRNSSWFRVDTIPPSVIIESPQNKSYKVSNIFINLSLSDASGIGACWYNLDYSSINTTLQGCLPTSISFEDGSHLLEIYVNDSVGNLNVSSVGFYVDATPPRWSNMQQAVTPVYSSNLSYFNVTWSDNGTIQSVLFESNFSGSAKNYSMQHLGGGVYGFNVSLPAGGFYWRSHANDSLGNRNSSMIQTFSVSRAGNPIYLYLNGAESDLTVNYGTQTNATGAALFGTVSLSRDGASVSNPEITLLAAKPAGYLYNVSVQENQNYSGNSTVNYLVVAKLEGNVSLYLNEVESNLTVTYGTPINATAWNEVLTPQLYRDGLLISSSEVGVFAAGFYNYTAIVAESENVTGSSKTFFLNVTKANPVFALELNGVESDLIVGYGTQTNVTGFENNFGDGDLIYTLFREDQFVGSGSVVADVGVYGAGVYNYIFNSSGGENYSAGGKSYVLNVTKAIPSLNLSLNGIGANVSQAYGNASVVSLSSNPGNLFLRLFRNGAEIADGSSISDSSLLAVGVYNFTGIFEGDANYSSASLTRFLTVEKAASRVELLLNGLASSLSVYPDTIVNISASLISPAAGEIWLYESSALVNSSNASMFYEKTYVSLGDFNWEVFYYGNENYSASNASLSVEVIDLDSPLYSNLRVSPVSPTYQPGGIYQFNSTWIDSIGIDEVLFEFGGRNYSYLDGEVLRNGDEYYFVLSDLAAGTYSYKWHGNDTSGNGVSSPEQSYEIQKRSTFIWITLSPGDSVIYGTTTIISCNANNAESQPELMRDITLLPSATDSAVLAAGSYIYSCTSIATENYTGWVAVPRQLNVNKASPTINVTLNGLEADLTLPSSGGAVAISAALVSPNDGALNLSVDGLLINSGAGPLSNDTTFSVVGTHPVTASYSGGENHTSGSVLRNVVVSAPLSGGGRSSGRSVEYVPPQSNENKDDGINIRFQGDGSAILKRGSSGERTVEVANTGKFFLNHCQLLFEGFAGTWFKNNQMKGLSPGERFSYNVSVSVPESMEPGNYEVEFVVKCDESRLSRLFEIVVYRNAFEAGIGDYEKTDNKLKVWYNLVEYIGKEHELNLEYALIDFDGVSRYIGKEKVYLGAKEEKSEFIEFELPKDSFGEFTFKIRLSDETAQIDVEKSIFLPSQGGLTGLTISDANRATLSYLGVIVLILAVLFFVVGMVRHIKRGMKKTKVLRSPHFNPKKYNKMMR